MIDVVRLPNHCFDLIFSIGESVKLKGLDDSSAENWICTFLGLMNQLEDEYSLRRIKSQENPVRYNTNFSRRNGKNRLQTSTLGRHHLVKDNVRIKAVLSKGIDTELEMEEIRLKDFQKLKCIGKGAYGTVYYVEQIPTGQPYAMKKIRKQLIRDKDKIISCFTELRILTKIDYPFLLKAHYAFQTEKHLFLILDFVNGGGLDYHLNVHTKFDEETTRFYISQILLAVEYLHLNRIIYRDLKPENVLLKSDGNILLIDFGISKKLALSTDSFTGTVQYMSPECIRGESYSFESDWWALGILMFEFLTGYLPFNANNAFDLFEQILIGDIFFPKDLSNSTRNLISRLTEKDLDYRLTEPIQLKRDSFFEVVDWGLLELLEVEPPFIPKVKNIRDLSNIMIDHRLLVSDEFSDIISADDSSFKNFAYNVNNNNTSQ